ncbi:MAG: helix-turn-helix domain-containing protein [Coriobacteriia bacterium]|nr:helix-turn-helix domain-containing protein [Coriobacteriia bacterium]
MQTYLSAETLKELRTRKGLTQEQLASCIGVTGKAVSKWETGRGLPDVSLVGPLAEALGVSVAELLTGDVARNANRSANIRRGKFYVCPLCGNVMWSVGEISASCCGSTMLPAEPEACDEPHHATIQKSDGCHVVTLDHPMTKDHFVSFMARVTCDQVSIRKLYPEQDAQAIFPMQGVCDSYAYCNRHGLFKLEAPKKERRA